MRAPGAKELMKAGRAAERPGGADEGRAWRDGARPSQLNCYFTLGFFDNEMLFPMIQTLVFNREETDAASGRVWLFAEPGSAEKGGRTFWQFPEPQLYQILDSTGLLEALGEVARDHPIQQPPPTAAPSATAELAGLPEQLGRCLSEEASSLTVTIRFTDDGFSLVRLGDLGLVLLLTLHAKTSGPQESLTRSLCSAAGLQAAQDYTANRGRTRILAYPVAADFTQMRSLATDLLLRAFKMRRDDTLTFRWGAGSNNG